MQFAKFLACAIAMAAHGLALPVDERAVAPAEIAERSYLIVAADEEPTTVEKRSYLIVAADEEAATVEKRSYLIVAADEEAETLERRATVGDTLIDADGIKYSLVPQTK